MLDWWSCTKFFGLNPKVPAIRSLTCVLDFQHGNLPDGFKWSTKAVQQFEWRCPVGEVCQRKDKMIYTKDTADEAAAFGAWHLFDKQLHADPEYSWQEAVSLAEGGVSEVTKNKSIVIDEEGNEVAKRAGSVDRFNRPSCVGTTILSLCRCTWAWQRLHRCAGVHGHGSDCIAV